MPRTAGLALTAEDSIFRGLVLLAMLLEIVVFIEPAPVDVLIVLCLGVGLMLGKLSFRAIGPLAPLALTVFAVTNLVSMYNAADPKRAALFAGVTIYLLASWLFFAGLAGHYGKPFVAMLIRAYCLAGVISALLGAGAYFRLLPYEDLLLLNGRARGLFKDCNVYGPYFVPMALFAMARLTDARATRRAKAAALAIFAAAALAMLLCFSRACWVNFGVAAGFYVGGQMFLARRNPQARRRIAVGAGILVAGGLATAALVTVSSVGEMFTQRVTSNGLQGYDRVRFATQAVALEAAQEHPLGVGPGQAEVLFDYSTHSMYVRILTENGLAGLLAVLIFIGATISRSVSVLRVSVDPWLREVNLIVLACIVGHLVNSFVIDTVHWRHIWFIYALPWIPVKRLHGWGPLARPREPQRRFVAATPAY